MHTNCLLKSLKDGKVKWVLQTGSPESVTEVEEKIGFFRVQLVFIYGVVDERDFTFLGFDFCCLV